MLEIGTKAPAFTLPDQDGTMISLSELKGKKIILYFYPKDNTPGCTKQACGYAQLYSNFKEQNAVILGISKDTVSSHKKFVDKFNLPFTILADPELSVIQAYDVWKEKNMYGRKTMGIVRSTYIINEEGFIEEAFSNVRAAENPNKMLAFLNK